MTLKEQFEKEIGISYINKVDEIVAKELYIEWLEKKYEKALDVCSDLKQALDRYGQHDYNCSYDGFRPGTGCDCNCGFKKLIEE